jgi:hypothetical protein
MYECIHVGPKGYGQFFSHLLWFCSDSQYCVEMRNCKNCFGCVGLKKEEYCLFNKKYSKEEYEELSTKIIQHMKETGEYGEVFPISMSPTPYNHTMAQQFYPMTKKDVLAKGWKWEDEKETIGEKAESEVPENIQNLPNDFPSKVFSCTMTKKKFRFTPQELDFYKKWGIPLPTISPVRRIENLWKKLGDRKLHDRTCSECSVSMQSCFPSESPERVLCAKCYTSILQ